MNNLDLKWIRVFTVGVMLILQTTVIFSQDSDTENKEILSEDTGTKKLKFEDLSLSIQKHSFVVSALEKEASSAEIGKNRTARHWHPRLYLDARAFNTNDPAMNFFSVLGQRDSRQSDFSTASVRMQPGNFLDSNNQPYSQLNSNTMNLFAPDTLNYPGSNTYQRGTIGLDLPLYEGGAKANIADSYDHVSKGKSYEKQAVILSEYSSNAALYAQLIFLDEYSRKVKSLKSQVQGILNSYQVGARSNPVGYSGLLGLKSVRNRLEGLETEVETRQKSIHEYLSTIAEDIGNDWVIQREPIPGFLNKHLPAPSSEQSSPLTAESLSYQAQAMKEYAESATKAAEVEKAKFLPRAGVFGESNLYSGSRNTATSYNVGFYVQMNLYNGEDIGSYEEARLKGEAAKEKALDQIRKESAKKKELLSMEIALQKQLRLLEESRELMQKQVVNSRRLFANGSINAIQMSEILSRSSDLLVDAANANREYILIRSQLYALFSR